MKTLMTMLIGMAALLTLAPVGYAQQDGQSPGWPEEYVWGPSFTCSGGPPYSNNCSNIIEGNQYYIAMSTEAMCTEGPSPDQASWLTYPGPVNNSVSVGLGPGGVCPDDIFATLVGDYGSEVFGVKADTSDVVTGVRVYYFLHENCWNVRYIYTNSADSFANCGIVLQ